MDIYEDDQGKNGSNRHPVDYRRAVPPIIYPLITACPMGTQSGFVLDRTAPWGYLPIKVTYWHGVIFPIRLYSSNQVPVLVKPKRTYLFYHSLQKVQYIRFTGGSIECEYIVYLLYVGGQGFVEVGKSLWWLLCHLFTMKHIGCKTIYFW